MFRFLFLMIGFAIAISVIKSVVGTVAKLFAGLSDTSGPAGTSGPRRPSSSASSSSATSSASSGSVGQLKKDPVCGTFISTETAFQKHTGGETYYFCSTQCRDRFKG
jgi:YHS domain-containing protein